jgi:nitric oxide synthase oxygenase domain/subunit
VLLWYEAGGTSIVNHLHQQPRVPWRSLTTKVNVKNTLTSHIDKKNLYPYLYTFSLYENPSFTIVSYGVYISQLIRYARASSKYSDFLKRHFYLRNRLLDQGYTKIRLIRSLIKFIFRYQDLVEIYSVSVSVVSLTSSSGG